MRLVLSLMSVVLLLVPVALVGAAEKGDSPFSKNGEMPRDGGTKKHWNMQADDFVAGDGPGIDGFHMWRGRADRDYKPFHQWEVRLRGGKEAVSDVKFRVTVLGPDMKPLLGKRGVCHWVALGQLGAGAKKDLSYKFNCSAPTAVRAELQWAGGSGSFFTADLQALPQPEAGAADHPKLLVLQPVFEYLPKKKQAKISFFLRNEGGKAASGVVHTVILRDSKGKEVHRAEHIPTKDGSVPAGFAEHIKFVLNKVPEFHDIAVSTKSAEQDQERYELEGGEFTGANDIEVAHVRVEKGELHGVVRNGLGQAVSDLVVSLELLGEDDKVMKTVDIPVGNLADDERKMVTAEVGKMGAVMGWNVGFQFGGGEAQAPKPAATSALPPVLVNGLELVVHAIAAEKGVVKLDISIANKRDEDLKGVQCELKISATDGTVAPIVVDVGDLATGATFTGALVTEGLADVAGVAMAWSAGG
ncbi:MAG: hypothetical protein PF961_03620 [Planctomycetota bacterium]|jgi:hypothetical protein|nr:hypothetical protein [Planctomycetota bacterium]